MVAFLARYHLLAKSRNNSLILKGEMSRRSMKLNLSLLLTFFFQMAFKSNLELDLRLEIRYKSDLVTRVLISCNK